MSFGSWLFGLACVAAVAAPLAVVSQSLRHRLAPNWSGAPARLAELVLAMSALVVLSQLLGTVGALTRAGLVSGSLLCGVVALLARRRWPSPVSRAATGRWRGQQATRHMAVAASAGAVLVLTQWTGSTRSALNYGMALPDTIWYHLPFAARFAEDGWLTRLHYTETEPVTAFYPANAELFHAIGMVLTGRDVLSPFINLGFLSLALIAGWCIGRPRGAGPLGVLGVSLALSIPVVWDTQAGQAGNDVVGTAFLLASAGIVACARGGGRGVVIAALAAGLAIGTKLSLVAPVLLLTLAMIMLASNGARARGALLWVLPLLLTGSFWYLRNLVRTGSPLPWVSFHLGPLEFSAPPRHLTEGLEYSVAHYAFEPHIWRDFFIPDLAWALGWAWPLILALATFGTLAAILRGAGWQRGLGCVVAVSALAYLFTPNGAAGRFGFPWGFGLNTRYVLPALALGLTLVALAPSLDSSRRRGLMAAAMLAALVFNLLAPTEVGQHRRFGALAVLVLLVVGLLLPVWRPRRLSQSALAFTGAVLVILGGFVVQRGYLEDRYAKVGPNVPRASVWARGLSGERIGVLGFVPQFPLYGNDLSNRVALIGEAGPRGAFSRIPDCRGWKRAVNSGRYRYLVVAPVVSPNLPPVPPRKAPQEAGWTRTDPAAIELLRDGLTSVFRVDRPLSPTACA